MGRKQIQQKTRSTGAVTRLSIRDEQKRVTYERLLNAAKELFESTGADEVTIDQIARHAGTNRTTFYLHFEDKAHIAFKIRVRYMQLDIDHINRLLSKPGGVTRVAINNWIKKRGNTVQRLKTVIELGTESLNKRPELMQEFLEQTDEILTTGFRPFLERFSAPERETARAELLLGAIMLNRYLYITVIQGVTLPGRRVREAVVDYWYRLLCRKPAGT